MRLISTWILGHDHTQGLGYWVRVTIRVTLRGTARPAGAAGLEWTRTQRRTSDSELRAESDLRNNLKMDRESDKTRPVRPTGRGLDTVLGRQPLRRPGARIHWPGHATHSVA